jgi:hypothetical protein
MHSQHSETNPRFVTAQVIAARYDITSRYVLQLAAAGKIPCLRLGNKCIRFDEDAVAEAIGLLSKNLIPHQTMVRGLPGGTP